MIFVLRVLELLLMLLGPVLVHHAILNRFHCVPPVHALYLRI